MSSSTVYCLFAYCLTRLHDAKGAFVPIPYIMAELTSTTAATLASLAAPPDEPSLNNVVFQ